MRSCLRASALPNNKRASFWSRFHCSNTPNQRTASNAGTQPDRVAKFCANSGLFLMAMTYLHQDMFYLRLTAMSSIAMSMVHQYKNRKISSLRWNILFLAINIGYLSFVHLHEEELPDDLKYIYLSLQEEGSTLEKSEVKKLFNLARKEVRNRGDQVMTEM